VGRVPSRDEEVEEETGRAKDAVFAARRANGWEWMMATDFEIRKALYLLIEWIERKLGLKP
jgi:hypothetical protein